MEIVQERLEREYNLDLLTTAPSVEYEVVMHDGSVITIDNPGPGLPLRRFVKMREPWNHVTIMPSSRYIGNIMELVTGKQGRIR